jgi:uncharacterized protein YbjT (DUF2867 family)
MDRSKPILLTGATGYIGGRLAPQLLAAGRSVRCLVRDPRRLSGRDWVDRAEIVTGDVLDRASLETALAGCSAAYYLVHAMGASRRGFEQRDRQAAENFARAAEDAGLEQIIYLGGLGRRAVADENVSAHLHSRHEVGDILRQGRTPVTELRAAMIIGSGSASFEILRALVYRLPVMICPKWVVTRTQPIAVRDVLAYLVGCLDAPATRGGRFDIGGPDILTYREMMERFARIVGLKRRMFVVPWLTPHLSAYWINLVTPVPGSIAFPLVEGLKAETICEEQRIQEIVPVERTDFETAVRRALDKIGQHDVETRWTNASLPGVEPSAPRLDLTPRSFPLRDCQRRVVDAPADVLFARIQRIGGEAGWHFGTWLWRVRGAIDRALGGVGLRRGRRDSVKIRIGDAIDFWRVEDFVPGKRLLLRAEMKVPGEALLEFAVRPLDDGRSELLQAAYFRPARFWGRLYWYGIYPVHVAVFRGMARNLARAAESDVAASTPS